MELKSGLTVSPGHVVGFGADVGDISDQFWSLASTTVNAIDLPSGARGLMADLVAPLAGFRDMVSDAHQQDREKLYKLSGDLSEPGRGLSGAGAHQ